ncbi:MAG: hypothetical protein ACXAEN_21850 [Candidatus Thorarchaeota archaeon]|jgi:hypothetical protein
MTGIKREERLCAKCGGKTYHWYRYCDEEVITDDTVWLRAHVDADVCIGNLKRELEEQHNSFVRFMQDEANRLYQNGEKDYPTNTIDTLRNRWSEKCDAKRTTDKETVL